ncbi:MAG: hypothetical protein DRR19_27555 [Candidatus Parabeggiatoa sp. nov. 1]|nr:MAG: hypothetical protein DRR19_27555 [Gammaproteobacteria bacterium]
MDKVSGGLLGVFSEKIINGKKYHVCIVNYADLLNLKLEGSTKAISRLIKAVEESDQITDQIIALLNSRNWRHQLIATIAILYLDVNKALIFKLWNAFDRGSWVCPQIAAALFLKDTNFIESAIERINNLCEIKDEELKKRWEKAGIKKIPRSSKGLISLRVLCEQIPSLKPWIEKKFQSPEILEVVGPDSHQIGNLCLNWMKDIKTRLNLMS